MVHFGVDRCVNNQGDALAAQNDCELRTANGILIDGMDTQRSIIDTFFGTTMGYSYFKRYRMSCDVRRCLPAPPMLPEDYRFVAWHPDLVEAHAAVKHRSFRWEIDAEVFACFNELEGCERLMNEISQRRGFLPLTTWLVEYTDPVTDESEFCATIQGIQTSYGVGNIQNVGTTPEHRGRGLGEALVSQALIGFQRAGLRKVFLEVTARNETAVRLYRRLGFRHARTVYKAVDIAYT